MPAFETYVEINASAETVWQLISDPQKIASWNPMVKNLVGKIAVGEAITLQGDSGELHATVQEIKAGQKIVWGGNSPMPGVKFLRTQTLERIAPGRVRYTNREELTSLLAALMFPLAKSSLVETYRKINSAIKNAAEMENK